MSISVIGFPDSGKSHWCQQWAKETGTVCIDSDEAVCQQHQQQCPRTLLQIHGKQQFDKIQLDWLSKLDQFKGVLICGGGLPLITGTTQLLTDRGPVVYLRRPWAWVQHNLNPGFHEQPVDIQWYQKRDRCYQAIATHVFEWHNQSQERAQSWKQLLQKLIGKEENT